jgi:Ser/Thr protein kinase RdoA (MazF antagonist)
MTAWRHVPHDPAIVPTARELLPALDLLHGALAGYEGELPFLGPATSDLDLALACCVEHGLQSAESAVAMCAQRDELLAVVAALPRTAQHGDAHPRNVLVTTRGFVWNDFEDCCVGSPLWDLATLARRDESGEVARVARSRFGSSLFEAMAALRGLQAETWTVLHQARAAGRV